MSSARWSAKPVHTHPLERAHSNSRFNEHSRRSTMLRSRLTAHPANLCLSSAWSMVILPLRQGSTTTLTEQLQRPGQVHPIILAGGLRLVESCRSDIMLPIWQGVNWSIVKRHILSCIYHYQKLINLLFRSADAPRMLQFHPCDIFIRINSVTVNIHAARGVVKVHC